MSTTVLDRPLEEIVAENIRTESARRGFSQSAIAREVGMSQPAVNQRWRGVTRWQLDELDSLARLFGVSVAYLVSDNAPVAAVVAPPTGLEPATSGLVAYLPGFAESDPESELMIAA